MYVYIYIHIHIKRHTSRRETSLNGFDLLTKNSQVKNAASENKQSNMECCKHASTFSRHSGGMYEDPVFEPPFI